MKFSHVFIDRPILASVTSIVVLIIGFISYASLPVSQYPPVAPPTVIIKTQYPGASPQVIADTVAAPIEQEVNGVEGMIYMYSQSTSDGVMSLIITFELGTDLDDALVQVQNRVSTALPRLPDEVQRIGVTTRKDMVDPLLVIHLMSPEGRYDEKYVTNFAQRQIRDVLARLKGVGNIQVWGGRDYSMRIWLDPAHIASIGMTAGDIIKALEEQNIQVAGGTLAQPPIDVRRAFQVSIQAQGRLTEVEQFENIVVKTGEDGRFTRLGDVARVELGGENYSTAGYLDGKPAILLPLTQTPGSNAVATSEAVHETMAELAKEFPDGLEYSIMYDPTEFIDESIKELYTTIFQATALVVLVILVFLQSWRASVIPLVTIPISLIGTFAFMAAFGFSINNLTLFGLVLAVGIVVDDAIVVVENIERNVAGGMSAREAARKTMDEVGTALIAIALVLSSVFIPVAFLEGMTGAFYRQFALTIAVATIISAFNALTLSPALGALLLGKRDSGRRSLRYSLSGAQSYLFVQFNKGFFWLQERYVQLVARVTQHSMAMVCIYLILIALTIFAFVRVPSGFIPPQDQGYLLGLVNLPEGASRARAEAVVRRAEQIVLETPGLDHAVSFVGLAAETRTIASNKAAIFAMLEPFDERNRKELDDSAILNDLRTRLSAIQEAFIAVFPPPTVRGLGTVGGYSLRVEDRGGRGLATLQEAAFAWVEAANQTPGLTSVYTSYTSNTPQLYVDIDRIKAEMLDVPIENVFEALEVYMGASYVNDFNRFGRIYRVIAQAEAPYRLDLEDISQLRTRSNSGAMVPLGSFVDFKEISGPDRVPRYNLYPTIEINGDTQAGYSTGQAISLMEELADNLLPDGITFEWTEMAYQQVRASNTVLFIFPLSVLFVFLALAALYESWSLPFAIILIVPMCLSSAIGGIMLLGMDNNILTQIGFIVLIGLASKNAILIVEFARANERAGKNRFEAAKEACRLRLRPILMTSFAFIFGVSPLLFASGAGYEMRQALGTTVFFGMLGVTIFGLLFTPVFYVMIRGFTDRQKSEHSSEVI
jgi:HAE1 family hydrophobic/amphiphilic exporter-1